MSALQFYFTIACFVVATIGVVIIANNWKYRGSDLEYFYGKYRDYRTEYPQREAYWPLQSVWLALGWAECRYEWVRRVRRWISRAK